MMEPGAHIAAQPFGNGHDIVAAGTISDLPVRSRWRFPSSNMLVKRAHASASDAGRETCVRRFPNRRKEITAATRWSAPPVEYGHRGAEAAAYQSDAIWDPTSGRVARYVMALRVSAT